MDPLTIGLLAGGLLGGVKSVFDKKRFNKENNAYAEAQKWDPWTKMAQGRAAPQRPDPFGNVLTGALSGGALGQGWLSGGEAPELLKPAGWNMDANSLEKYLRGGARYGT